MTEEYSIRELAQEFGVTTRALRFYEEKGLLSPTRNNQSRCYNSTDRTRLKLIMRGKRLGFSLDESSEIISMYDPTADNRKQTESLIKKVHEKRKLLIQQQKDLKSILLDLQNVEDRCLTALNKHR